MLPIVGHEYGCPLRIHREADHLAVAAVRLVVVALAALVLHDVALRAELRLVERVEEKAHAIGLEPERGLEIVRRIGLPVARPVEVRLAVVAAADAFGELVVHAVRHVARAGEHHVLEHVREAGAADDLVLRADVIDHVDGDGRRRVVLGRARR